jgi:hypothetical protein
LKALTLETSPTFQIQNKTNAQMKTKRKCFGNSAFNAHIQIRDKKRKKKRKKKSI